MSYPFFCSISDIIVDIIYNACYSKPNSFVCGGKQMVAIDQLIGQKLNNYHIVEKISSGAFGSVYKGKHTIFSERPIVAIKLLHTNLATNREKDRFIQEAILLAKLKHSHILSIIDAGEYHNLPYLVIDYASGASLRDLIQREQKFLSLEQVVKILVQICQALNYSHQQNIVHRDIKPENILFNSNGEALLADFGIAAVLDTSETKRGDVFGTLAYIAPEQFRGEISKKSDQYALGIVAYELFTGVRPFSVAPGSPISAWEYKHSKEMPKPLVQINPQVPVTIENNCYQ